MDFNSVYTVIDYIGEHAKSTAERGSWWERAVMFYLRHDPEMRQIMGEVTLWEDAPTNDGHDTGIDIVCEYDAAASQASADGRKYWAVQCKNYDAAHKMDYKELSTFWAKAVADERYAGYVVVSASDFTQTALDYAEQTGTLMITPEKMDESSVNWNAFVSQSGPENRPTFDLREHQQNAVDAINRTLEDRDRCKAILACGTGKTLMSLRLAEGRCPSGTVLFCAPSIALVSQAMREWTNQARVDLRSLVVCSDSKASRVADYDDIIDALADLAFPASTDVSHLLSHYRYVRSKAPNSMVVVFTTYQSMQVIADAQAAGLPEFDLVVCDEAHRTTGVKATDNEDTTSFLIVHDQNKIHGSKRVYMTATPRIYGDQAHRTAREQSYVLTSMDDEATFGPTAYEITFSEAVERGLLCDYRVVVLAVREEAMPADMQRTLSDGSEMEMSEAAKIIGCYKGLATHGVVSQQRIDSMFEAGSPDVPDFFLIDEIEDLEAVPELERDIEPLHRAVGFCRSIQDSKNLGEMFNKIVTQYNDEASDAEYYDLTCALDHVDGSMNSKVRQQKLSWLASADDRQGCNILTNARCLAEGVDVPSLDAVIFFSPRKSEVDVVQAVGRVMRTFKNEKTGEEKKLGYIILPVFIPEGLSPEEALNNSKTFDVVWKVLQALRSHDERIEAYVNSFQFRKKKQGKGTGIGKPAREGGGEQGGESGTQLQITFSERLAEAIYTKAVDKVGTRIYWDSWAEDVAHIAERHIQQINDALATDATARDGFDTFIKGLRESLNPGISEADAIEMVAQHMITLPVFDALFGDFQFAKSNPVSVAIDEFLQRLEGHGVGEMSDSDRKSLDDLYASVARRAKMVRTDNGRQALIKNLYEDFFKAAFKATTDKLGIVYTPDEIVNYILHATDRALKREFGKSISDEGVHVLDPFAGTGTFIARLIEDEELMPLEALPHKYAHELHSNEILLLAYYIMVVNIEYAYHARTGDYREFEGALLTDTFQMTEQQNQIDEFFFVDNSIRQLEQADLDITVVIGNPPYQVGQDNENDNNKNEKYPTLDERIRTTYVERSEAVLNNSLYDSYIRAFRWASDRIGDEGIVCFVSNGGWLRSSSGAGVRRTFAKEFDSIYALDLRGHKEFRRMTRAQMDAEGDNVFGSGSRASIVITLLVKNRETKERGIHYLDIGPSLSLKEKLDLSASFSQEEPNWEIVEQDERGDWVDKRDGSYYDYAPMGMKKRSSPLGIFAIWSGGVKTNRDTWAISYSREMLAANMSRMTDAYCSELERWQSAGKPLPMESFVTLDEHIIKWTRELKADFVREKPSVYQEGDIRPSAYRPFSSQWVYMNRQMNNCVYLQPELMPFEEAVNFQIALSGEKGFSALMTSRVPDLHYVGDSQCFPLYYYEQIDGSLLFESEAARAVKDALGNRYIRRDAITDTALSVFQSAYPHAYISRAKKNGGAGINKEDVFYYVYGVLHSPEYRKRFAANLAKELPRIPLVRDFESFADAGRQLAHLHLHYEELEPWPTVSVDMLRASDPGPVKKIVWAKKKDPETGKRVPDYTKLVYNANLTITGIPEEAQNYVVNGRSPIDWVIDRYQVKTDKKSGITNDPNDYSDDPWYIVDLIVRLVRVSMETQQIVQSLPTNIDEIPHPDNWPVEWTASLKGASDG